MRDWRPFDTLRGWVSLWPLLLTFALIFTLAALARCQVAP